MIKVLIVEDEYTIALDIEERLKEMGFEITGNVNSYDKALAVLLENEPDIALLDINLEQSKSGIELGKLIYEKFELPIVFLSAYSDELTFTAAQKAYPMGFLTKPFKDSDLNHTIKLALKRFQEIKENESFSLVNSYKQKAEDKYIFIKDKNRIFKVNQENILWLEAMDNYTIIHQKGKKITANANLKTVLSKLNPDNFIRIHKSHAVALDKIEKIEDNIITIGKIFLVISRKYKKELAERLNFL